MEFAHLPLLRSPYWKRSVNYICQNIQSTLNPNELLKKAILYICHRINFGLTWPGNQGRHKLSSAHFGHLYKSSEHAFFLTNALYLDASYFNMDYVTHTSGLLAMLKCLSCELARALWPQPFIPVKANGISDLSLYPDTIRMFFCCQCSILCLILELNIFKGQLQYC